MKPMLTPNEVAELLGGDTTATWVREQCAAGEIPAFKIARQWKIDPDEFKKWLAQQRHIPSPAPWRPEPSRTGRSKSDSLAELVKRRAEARDGRG